MHFSLLQIILTIWTGLALVNVILVLIAVVMLLTSNSMNTIKKLIWTLVVIFLPLLGSIIFFTGKLVSSKEIVQ
jgi:hypothetical protein